MNKPIEQHDLPATYLRKFVINPNDPNEKSFVWCSWKNEFETKIERVSVKSNLFKKTNFYTVDNVEDPYIVETSLFNKYIEPLYNKIIAEIEGEENLSQDCRSSLIQWLFFNKFRNKAYRDYLEKLLYSLSESQHTLVHGKEKFDSIKDKIKKSNQSQSKELQLRTFLETELLEQFEIGIGTKHWVVLKSPMGCEFITNDNPGFSLNYKDENVITSLSNLFATNDDATNFFVLSPKYCLEISPILLGTPLHINFQNQLIEYKTISNSYVARLNKLTTMTRTKYLISNSEAALKNMIQD